MKTPSSIKALAVFGAVVFASGVFAGSAQASHSWVDYHWARTANPFALKLGDNVSSAWDAYLNEASTDWTTSAVLDTTVVAGSANPRTCKTVAGTVQVCNAAYGNNGWLGLASINIDSAHHITKGYVKLNDTYFNWSTYNTPAWRRLVTCQEVGHTFGLDHQDTTFDNVNLGTCMDYTNAPAGGVVGNFNYGPSNEHPNKHDYDQLVTIYTHTDLYTTLAATVSKVVGRALAAVHGGNLGANEEFGTSIGYDASGRANRFEKDLGNGEKKITNVFWAQ